MNEQGTIPFRKRALAGAQARAEEARTDPALSAGDHPPFLSLRLLATGKAEADTLMTAAMLDEQLRQPAGYSFKMSGIRSRRFSSAAESQSQLAARALGDAVRNAGVDPASIDLLIAACGVQEQALPSTACAIAAHAGLPAGTPAFDVNASCLGFVVALKMAASLLASGSYRRIAVVSADQASHGLDWSHPESSLIFGDGAAAALVERGQGRQGIRSFGYQTYTEGRRLCEIRGGGTGKTLTDGAKGADFLFSMNGKQVLKLALQKMPSFMNELLAAARITLDSIDVVVPHQASHLGMAHMIKRMGLDKRRIVDIYPTHGNQVAASIPTALHEALSSGLLGPGRRALLVGTAAGVSLGGLVLDV